MRNAVTAQAWGFSGEQGMRDLLWPTIRTYVKLPEELNVRGQTYQAKIFNAPPVAANVIRISLRGARMSGMTPTARYLSEPSTTQFRSMLEGSAQSVSDMRHRYYRVYLSEKNTPKSATHKYI